MSNKGGRPLKFKNPEDLQDRVDKYFEEEKEYPTLAGLAHYLDIDRQTLYNYEKREEFFDIITRARERVEANYEKVLVYGKGGSSGVQFALKNMGWKDRQEIKQDITGQTKIVINRPDGS